MTILRPHANWGNSAAGRGSAIRTCKLIPALEQLFARRAGPEGIRARHRERLTGAWAEDEDTLGWAEDFEEADTFNPVVAQLFVAPLSASVRLTLFREDATGRLRELVGRWMQGFLPSEERLDDGLRFTSVHQLDGCSIHRNGDVRCGIIFFARQGLAVQPIDMGRLFAQLSGLLRLSEAVYPEFGEYR